MFIPARGQHSAATYTPALIWLHSVQALALAALINAGVKAFQAVQAWRQGKQGPDLTRPLILCFTWLGFMGASGFALVAFLRRIID